MSHPPVRWESVAEGTSRLSYLKDENGVLRVVEQMVRLPLAEPGTREWAFVELSGALSPYVRPDDPEKERKLNDLQKWIHCGEEALGSSRCLLNISERSSWSISRYNARFST
jgi:hypothetical protein